MLTLNTLTKTGIICFVFAIFATSQQVGSDIIYIIILLYSKKIQMGLFESKLISLNLFMYSTSTCVLLKEKN